MARRREQLGRPRERARRIGRPRAGIQRQQLIAQAQVIAGELAGLLGTFGRAHHRDLGFGAELREDA